MLRWVTSFAVQRIWPAASSGMMVMLMSLRMSCSPRRGVDPVTDVFQFSMERFLLEYIGPVERDG